MMEKAAIYLAIPGLIIAALLLAAFVDRMMWKIYQRAFHAGRLRGWNEAFEANQHQYDPYHPPSLRGFQPWSYKGHPIEDPASNPKG